jgi:ABC-type multidrug transport system fused ATPase/permease subunit
MIDKNTIKKKTIGSLLKTYPFLEEFLRDHFVDVEDARDMSLVSYLNLIDPEILEEKAIIPEELIQSTIVYLNQMIEFLGIEEEKGIESITLKPGYNKFGERENFKELKINKGEIISIVGPTGSGKSRLLADIEWGANTHTTTI